MKEQIHGNPFLESGCRCEICDDFGTKNIPVKGSFVCEKCKNKKETKLFLEQKRISGLVDYYLEKTKTSYNEYLQDCEQLEFLLKQQRELNENESKYVTEKI